MYLGLWANILLFLIAANYPIFSESSVQKPISSRRRQLKPFKSENVSFWRLARGWDKGMHTDRLSLRYGFEHKSGESYENGSIPISHLPHSVSDIISSIGWSLDEIVLSGNLEESFGSNTHRGAGAHDSTIIVRLFLSNCCTILIEFFSSSRSFLHIWRLLFPFH